MVEIIKPGSVLIRYKIVVLIYLISVLSYSIANSLGDNVQKFYRIPFLNIRWIDTAIIFIVFSFFYSLTYRSKKVGNTSIVVPLGIIYLLFETFQLLKSWGLHDAPSQISYFLCTLSMIIVIDLSTYAIPVNKIVSFLKTYAICGAFVIIVSNLYLLYSFNSGNVVFEDLDIRVALEVVGSKETVYPFVLTPFVYAFGLYFIQRQARLWQKTVFICAILSIYGALAITFHRGTLVTILLITIYFIVSGRTKQIVFKLFWMVLLMTVSYLLLGDTLSKKGYDPVVKITETARFMIDFDNPSWDKGRSVSQKYALDAWKKNLWTGAGYDELLHYGLPEDVATAHNGVITSLFHRGILGTILLLSILIISFKSSINLWLMLCKESSYQNDIMKLLILVSFFWIITFMTQEALREKYSLSIQFIYLGLIINYYKQLN